MAFILSFSFRFRKHWKWNFHNSEHRELQPVLVMATWLNTLMISGPFRLRLWRTILINLHTKFINILGWSKARTIVCHVTKIDVKGPGATQRIEVLNGKASLWGPTLYPFLTGKVPPFNGIPSLKNGTAFTYLLKVSVKENEVPTEKNSSRASIFAIKGKLYIKLKLKD